MSPLASKEQELSVENKIAEQLPDVLIKKIQGKEQVIIAAIGDALAVQELGLEAFDGVDKIVEIAKPYKLASSELTSLEPSEFIIPRPTHGSVTIGAASFVMIAGPCTVETRQQTLQAAQDCVDGGAQMLRAGLFKPRTSPFAFQGLGEDGFDLLKEIRLTHNIPIVSEAKNPHQADQLAQFVDVIQVGARNMQNYELLTELGKLPRPVLLKRGFSATADELLMAADYILQSGQEQVILCERGIRTYEQATRFTLDLSIIPYLKLHTHLPVIVDPSHAPGDRRLVPALSRAAAAVGADGLIVETTPDPEAARCDAAQQLHSAQFAQFNKDVLAHAALLGRYPLVED